jgi:AcrR family transcriptional regulator
MKSDSTTVDKTPAAGRPRDPRIDASILRAASELLVEVGYSNLTMAGVAERAGTTKTALYRRWSSKADLVHEAAFPAAPTALVAPSNSFADDVRAMVVATRDVFTTPVVRAALPGLVADMASDPELNARVMRRFAGLFVTIRDRVARGIDEGDALPGVDPDALVEIMGGAAMLRLLLRPGEDLDDQWAEQALAIILKGVVA